MRVRLSDAATSAVLAEHYRMQAEVCHQMDSAQLDNLRSEASRLAKGSKMDWWVERTDKGACFCFEDLEAKTAFVSICQNFGVQHLDGRTNSRCSKRELCLYP
jgi:hypothetical protein